LQEGAAVRLYVRWTVDGKSKKEGHRSVDCSAERLGGRLNFRRAATDLEGLVRFQAKGRTNAVRRLMTMDFSTGLS
jgi:hypothetical protein